MKVGMKGVKVDDGMTANLVSSLQSDFMGLRALLHLTDVDPTSSFKATENVEV